MILLVDVGNTRLKWATLDGAGLIARGVFAHVGVALDAALRSEWSTLDAIDRVLVASVVASTREAELAAIVRARFGVDAEFPRSPAFALGIRNAYAEPARLGIDRFLGLAAAHAARARAQVLLSVGTALTLDALGADGVHHGGLIIASPRLMREAILGKTARVDARDGTWSAMPTNTVDAVVAGSLYAATGAITAFCAEAERRLGASPALLLAGGGADELAPRLPGAERVHDLVLRGLGLWSAAVPRQAG